VNDSPEAANPSWEVSTTPVEVSGGKPTATVVIDSRTVDAEKLASFLDILYGTDANPGHGSEGDDDYVAPTEATEGYLPLPDDIAKHFATTP
jgi:hypothetical protein